MMQTEKNMELILWRHAEAGPGEPDHDRALTARGRKQARKMAEWLSCNLPGNCKILVSPAVRAVQTAEALERKFKIHPGLAPDVGPEDVLEAVNWPDEKQTVLIVGHQPWLGQVASLLIAGIRQDWVIRKANVWWISQRFPGESPAQYVRAVISPDLLGKRQAALKGRIEY